MTMAGNPADIGYQDAIAVTPSDTVIFNPPLRALYIGTAAPATLVVVTAAGNTVTFGAVTAGSTIWLECTQVKAATGATNIVGYR